MLRTLTATLLLTAALFGAECPPQLSPAETLARFQQHDKAGQAAFEAGRFEEAVREYSEAACVAPKSARAYFGLGGAAAAIGNFTTAQEAFEKASVLLPGNPMPLAMLLRVKVAMQDDEGTRGVLRLAAKQFPRDASVHAGFARFLAEKEMLELALAEALRAEELGATEAESTVALAALENGVGAYEDAARQASIAEARKGISDVVRASAAGVAGLSFANLGNVEEAAKHLRLAIRLAPAQENSWLALAFVFEKAQRFAEAADGLKSAKQKFPNSTAILLALGNNLVWAEQFPAGVKTLSELVAKAPKTEEAYIRLAEAYRKTGQPALEVQMLQQLAQVNPDYPMIHIQTAQALMTLDPVDYPLLWKELQAAQVKMPSDADVYYLRGKAFLALNRNEEAVAQLNRAVELRSLDSSFYYQLGLAYRKAGHPEKAQEVLARMNHLK